MTHEFPQPFAWHYESLLKRLKLRGMQPKTIEAYSHGVCRAALYFNYHIDDLNKDQLTDYFAQILDDLSWGTVKLGLILTTADGLIESCSVSQALRLCGD